MQSKWSSIPRCGALDCHNINAKLAYHGQTPELAFFIRSLQIRFTKVCWFYPLLLSPTVSHQLLFRGPSQSLIQLASFQLANVSKPNFSEEIQVSSVCKYIKYNPYLLHGRDNKWEMLQSSYTGVSLSFYLINESILT